MTTIRLATRASPLALWQARTVAAGLRRAHRGLRVVLVTVTAGGDRDLSTPLHAMGGVGVFVKEVQALVATGRADAGVHSLKDLPTAGPAELALAAILPRADARDCLVGAVSLAALPEGAVVGTSSRRRQVQLAAVRPDLRFADLRGNVGTRLRKLAAGEAAATVLAAAGLRRLGLLRTVGAVALDPLHVCTPAPGQGAIAVDCRRGDRRTQHLLAALHCRTTATATAIERELLALLEGGCALPLGAWARRAGHGWRLDAALPGADGRLRRLGWSAPAHGLAARAFRDFTSG